MDGQLAKQHFPADLKVPASLEAITALAAVTILHIIDDRTARPRFVIAAENVHKVAEALEEVGGDSFDHQAGAIGGTVLRNISEEGSKPKATNGTVYMTGFMTGLRTGQPFILSVLDSASFHEVIASDLVRELAPLKYQASMGELFAFLTKDALEPEKSAGVSRGARPNGQLGLS